MDDRIVSLESARRERELKKQFPTDYALVIAFYLAKRLHVEDLGEREGELLRTDPDTLQRWVQKRLADEVETRHTLRTASVYKMVPYAAKLLVTYRGLPWDEWTPVRRLDTDNPFEVLRIAEDSFLAFCFYPEERERRQLKYRAHAFEVGTQAYRAYGHAKKNPIGKDMEYAFAPLGTLIREIFAGRI